jgi:hypothetical protein
MSEIIGFEAFLRDLEVFFGKFGLFWGNGFLVFFLGVFWFFYRLGLYEHRGL